MLDYTLKRIGLCIVTLFVIITITFFAMNAIPGGPFDSEKAPSEQVKQVLLERYHLDKPLGEQYILYLKNLLHGDFGVSLKTGRNISDTISQTFGISLSIGFRAIFLSLIFGVFFGSIAAFNKDLFLDRFIMLFTTLFVSIPSFIAASLLLYIFCLKLKLIPVWSVENKNYILPVISLMIYPLANINRLTRTSMIDALSQDYIRTAKAKGVSTKNIIFKHALRNALIPVLTYIGPMSAFVITGSFVIETIFTIGGLGMEFVTSITTRDYSMIMGTSIFLASLVVIISLISDLCYKIVDPRIKFD
ncbi:MAG: ABC transporter permease [Eubacteriales bacterium]|nr:ABC transporter permease [Eubacteriales bacterium]